MKDSYEPDILIYPKRTSPLKLLVLNAPYTERYVRCGERTGAYHSLLLDYDGHVPKGLAGGGQVLCDGGHLIQYGCQVIHFAHGLFSPALFSSSSFRARWRDTTLMAIRWSIRSWLVSSFRGKSFMRRVPPFAGYVGGGGDFPAHRKKAGIKKEPSGCTEGA